MTTESIKEERFLIAAFPSPESSKFPRILADSSAYNSCSVEVRLSSLISDRPNSPFAVCSPHLFSVLSVISVLKAFPSYRESTLESRNSAFLISNPDGLVHSAQENFPIADFSSGRALQNRVYRLIH